MVFRKLISFVFILFAIAGRKLNRLLSNRILSVESNLLIIISLILIDYSYSNSQPQFQSVNLNGGGINSIAYDSLSRTILVGTTSGLYKSTNFGEFWERVVFPNPFDQCSNVFVSRMGAWFGVGTFPYRSLNQGMTWELLPYPDNLHWFGSLGFSQNPLTGTIIAPIDSFGYFKLFRSTSNGVDWECVYSAQGSSGKSFCTPTGEFVIANESNLLISTNDGVSWDIRTSSLFDASIISFSQESEGVWLTGMRDGDLVRSTNYGQSWVLFRHFDWEVEQIFCSQGDALFVSAGSVFRKQSFTSPWETASRNVSAFSGFCKVDTVLFCGGYQIFCTQNCGINWQIRVNGIHSENLFDIIAVDSTILLVPVSWGVARSNDQGVTWSLDSVDYELTAPEIVQVDPTNFYLAEFTQGLLYHTTDVGNSWTMRHNFQSFISGLTVDVDSTLMLSVDNGIVRSTDHGMTWTTITNQTGFVGRNNLGDYFSLNMSAGLCVSTNRGVSWTTIHAVPSVTNLGIYVNTEDDLYFHVRNILEKSTNNGVSWTPISLPNVTMVTNDFKEMVEDRFHNLYIGYNYTLFRKSVNTSEWTDLHLHGDISKFHIDIQDHLYVATYGYGLYRSVEPLSVEGIPEFELIPNSTELIQNYPNPFNSTTTISYNLSRNSNVELKLFDETGRGIKTLFNRTQSSGIHSVLIDGSSLPSGKYFVRLKSGDFTQTRTITLVK